MHRWKIAFFVVLLVALASNAYWFIRVVDGSISYSYLNDSYVAESGRFEALSKLVVAGSAEYSQADFLHLLRQSNRGAFIVEDEDRVVFEGIEFVFLNDSLTEVR